MKWGLFSWLSLAHAPGLWGKGTGSCVVIPSEVTILSFGHKSFSAISLNCLNRRTAYGHDWANRGKDLAMRIAKPGIWRGFKTHSVQGVSAWDPGISNVFMGCPGDSRTGKWDLALTGTTGGISITYWRISCIYQAPLQYHLKQELWGSKF